MLLLGDTLVGGTASAEYVEAVALGLTPTVVTGAQWGAMTASEFAAYDAIVIGDPRCSNGYLGAAVTNAATWSSVLDGNITIVGSDASYHYAYGPHAGAQTLIRDVISFAASTPGKTGAYIALGCEYAGVSPGTTASVLQGLGAFTLTGQSFITGCPNLSHIVATSPALLGLADADLSNWSCSVHEVFNAWPATGVDAFSVLAINQDITTTGYVATDGSLGAPYILTRGPSVVIISNIKLTPDQQTVDVGGTATLTATITENGTPVGGKTVTVTVIGGPNNGSTFTATTDASGNAAISYGGATAGIDTLVARYVDTRGATQTSNNALVEWKVPAPIDTTPPACALTGVGVDPATGKKYIQITVQDTGSGLKSVVPTLSVNADTPIPAFTEGTTNALVVTATKIDQATGARVELTVTDVAGLVTTCDPLVAGEAAAPPAAGGCGAGPSGFASILGLLVGAFLSRRRRS